MTTGVSYEELQQLPSARDPWVILQTVPGVVVDRVNVGGAESGQQSNYLAKGAGLADNTWNLDGIPVTDLAATGSSPTYYNFDMFQEMSVTTGGASATNPTAGVQLNMQFKTGANRPSGAAHLYGAGEGLQSNNLPDDLVDLAGPSGKGNRMKDLTDYGFDVGGSDHARQMVGVGLVRTHREHALHAERRSRQDHARERRLEVERADHPADPSGVPVLPRQQDQDRPRGEPAAGARSPPGIRPVRRRSSRGRST